MARLFDDALSQFLERSSPVVTAYPFTVACWFNHDAAVNQTLWCVADTVGNDNFWRLHLGAGNDVRFSVRFDGTGEKQAVSSTTGAPGTWRHACGVATSASSRAAFLDGGGKGTNAVSGTPAGLDNTTIGVRKSLTPLQYFSGLIAELAVWDIALSDDDVAVLAANPLSALFLHPEALVSYVGLIGNNSPETDLMDAATFAVTGATKAAHPRVLTPAPILRSPVLVSAVNLAGTVTPAGALTKAAAKPFGGIVAPAGSLAKAIAKTFAGTITPAGSLALLRFFALLLAGSISPTGVLRHDVGKLLSGSVAPAGALAKLNSKVFSGTVTPTGALIRVVGKMLGGGVTPSGLIVKDVAKLLAGSIAPVGLVSLVSSVVSAVGSVFGGDRRRGYAFGGDRRRGQASGGDRESD